MKLSESTLSVLKNFASINNNILIQPGNLLKTVNDAEIKLIFANATVQDTFPEKVGIFDLNEFLNVVSLLGGAEETNFEFETKRVVLSSQKNRSRVQYWYAADTALSYPEKDIKMPEPQVSFEMTGAVLSQLRRAASTFGHSTLAFFNTDDLICAKVFDPEVTSSNTFEMDICNLAQPLGVEFNFLFNIQNLKSLSFGPTERIKIGLAAQGKGKISQFIGDVVTYYVSVDSDSTMKNKE